MNSLMSNETVLTGKRFIIFLVPIRLFSTMDFAMGTEVLPSAKGFPTFGAGVRPFSTVNSVMYNYVPVLEKRFIIFIALERLFSSVDFLGICGSCLWLKDYQHLSPFRSVNSLMTMKA